MVPAEGPNAASTEQVVRGLRALPPVDDDVTLGVAGQAAIDIDISESLMDVLPLYLLVVVGISLVITLVVFRSLVVPLIATGGFVLSFAAMLGAVVAVFQWGWLAGVFGIPSAGPVLSFLPLIFVGILFGLAMDYQLFLATGMREAFVHGAPARVAVTQGFRAGRTVVVAAEVAGPGAAARGRRRRRARAAAPGPHPLTGVRSRPDLRSAGRRPGPCPAPCCRRA